MVTGVRQAIRRRWRVEVVASKAVSARHVVSQVVVVVVVADTPRHFMNLAI
jgi:hypothetical protein